jgi:hypothetical protein
MKKIIISLVLMITFFLISGLFFLNSGIIKEDNWEVNKSRAEKILIELDSMPLIRINVENIDFDEIND